ncbi:hypothetical protein SAMN06298216_1721 [Spirosomataceae bacterium TFI 002]|nr:hypothetical protein SAMN06298216_1721 [Spirosomataceae bacterium TFI 002]
MKIFNNYTGNAMLNNALMTIEALGKVNSIEEITTDLLLKIYDDKKLLKLNRRLKSYTMLFTKNGPLHNDKTNGEKVYDGLIKKILASFENEGNKTCEISGLKFETSFDDIFKQLLKELKYPDKDIKKKDTTINRNWFPLIGGLGSDAQSLPQAKFTYNIHPICIAILQFLPLSAFLYKGGVLLIDSSNFILSKRLIAEHVKILNERISTKSSSEAIENVKDFSKGNYIQNALNIMDEFEENEYADLNLWSFSNSGTGASCEIDRVPNLLIKKLLKIKINSPSVGLELKRILNRNESAHSFLECLEDNKEWWLLYPNVFGSGKKATDYKGCSIDFLEAYFKAINKDADILNARHISYLISKYKTVSFEKYLGKTDAWNAGEFRIDLFKVLCEAAKNDEWDLDKQISILDNKDSFPVKNQYYQLHKLVHFYYQNEVFESTSNNNEIVSSNASKLCFWLIAMIDEDEKSSSIIKDLQSTQEYKSVSFNGLLLRNASKLELFEILGTLYSYELKSVKFGLNELLHLYYLQKEKKALEFQSLGIDKDFFTHKFYECWANDIKAFSSHYKSYYLAKYKNPATGKLPYEKLNNQISKIPSNTSQFLRWFEEAYQNTNETLKKEQKWDDSLLYNHLGEFSPGLFRFIFKFIAFKDLDTEVQF